MLQDTAHMTQHTKQDTSEQEPSGPGHRTRNIPHRAGTQVNRSQVAKDTAHATQCSGGAHR